MKNFSILVFLLSFTSWEVFAKPSKTQKTLSFDTAEAVVSFGEQQSTFRLWTEKNKKMYYFTSSTSAPEKRELSTKDYQFFTKRISGLLEQESNDLQYCPRSNMTLTVVMKKKTLKKLACIGSKTPIAKDFTKLANSLSLAL